MTSDGSGNCIIRPHVQGYDTPLVADIHFAPQIAMDVAEVFEKIRINPGNFVDGRKTFAEYVYDSKVGFSAGISGTYMKSLLESAGWSAHAGRQAGLELFVLVTAPRLVS